MQILFGLCFALGILTVQEPAGTQKTPIGRTVAKQARYDDNSVLIVQGNRSTPVRSGKGKFTISKETTFVTGPLGKDGYIDYAAALNERLRQGVTPANNANVLLWKAMGPRPEGSLMPAEFFLLMGIEALPEKGDYFIDLTRYLQKNFKLEAGEETEATHEELIRCAQRPWKAEEYPKVSSWLKVNEKPLALVVEATKRTQYYSPLVPTKTEKGSSGLISSLLPGAQRCRELASALAARAMLKASRGTDDDAWQDLLACHRLGRLVGHGATLVEALVGIAIEGVASRADLAYLDQSKPKAKRIESHLRDLQQLPPFPSAADKVDLGERFIFLDSVMMIDRNGMQSLKALAADALPNDPNALNERLKQGIDWDAALQNGNLWFDRMATGLREKDPELRKKKLEQIDADVEAYLKALKLKTASPKGQAELLSGGAKGIGKVIGDILIGLVVPAVHKVQRAWDRVQQVQDNLKLAFALEWYRRDHGYYPKKLDLLAPKYLRQIPGDVFSGKALIYRPGENGYLLYSVGMNGKDEGGRGQDDDPPGDDLSVRMPLPEQKQK